MADLQLPRYQNIYESVGVLGVPVTLGTHMWGAVSVLFFPV